MTWCHNHMILTGEKNQIDSFLDKLRTAEREEFDVRDIDLEIDNALWTPAVSRPKDKTEANFNYDTEYHQYGAFIRKIAREYPQLRIVLSYSEYYSDLCGRAVFEHGELVDFEKRSFNVRYCDEYNSQDDSTSVPTIN